MIAPIQSFPLSLALLAACFTLVGGDRAEAGGPDYPQPAPAAQKRVSPAPAPKLQLAPVQQAEPAKKLQFAPIQRAEAVQKLPPYGNPPQIAQTGPAQQVPGLNPSGPGTPPKKSDWTFSLGGGAMYGTAYTGSDKYVVTPLPDVSVEYRDGLFFANMFDGIGSYPLQGENYKVGASIGWDFGRSESDDKKNLRGMGDIDAAITANLMGEYSVGPLRLSGKLTKGTGDYGMTGTFEVGTMFPLFNDKLMVMASAGPTFADGDHMRNFFGVSGKQAARSGYRRYEPEAGLKSVGFTVGAFYALTENIDIKLMLKADQLLGDAADSPITKEKFQPSSLLTAVYKF